MTTAMVTGASSGIGLEFARELGSRGHDLLLVSPEAERLARVCGELSGQYGVEAEAVVADLSVRADVTRVAERAATVDVLVNNAGFGLEQWFLDNEQADEEALLDVLCRAVLVLSHAAGQTMRDRGSGTIINVASIAGWVAGGTYSAAKSWVIAFSESLAAELKGTGVQVTVVCPGLVRTEFHQRSGITVAARDSLWLDPRRVARDGLRAAARGRAISVPGTVHKGLAWLARVAPRRFVRSGGKITSHRPPLR